nr:hypothetical protein [Tanacetum cinerariifolium]
RTLRFELETCQGDSLNLPDHSLVPAKSNSYYQAFNVKSLFWEIDGPKKSQVELEELLRAPTEGYAEAIMVPLILAKQFELKHSLINKMTSDHDANSSSSSEIAKLTHAVNQQTSVVTTVMAAILKKFQATPLPASVKAVEEICVTCGGAHPYYQCLAADGDTFLELRDNIQGYILAVAVNYNQGSGPLLGNTIANPKEEDERVKEALTDPELDEFTIKVPPPLV